jgi:hypothetical protein
MRIAWIVALALASCAGWNLERTEPHPALRPGAALAVSTRGRGAEHERRVEIEEGGVTYAPGSVEALMERVRPIDSGESAIAYGDLVRRLRIPDAGVAGDPITPDSAIAGPGGSGHYSAADAEAWGIPFEPTAEPWGGGWAVRRVVLYAPVQHPLHVRVATPWRLVQVREVVYRDGTIRALEERTLSDGQDAARFAVH